MTDSGQLSVVSDQPGGLAALNALPPTPPGIVERMMAIQNSMAEFDQAALWIEHVLHAGLYARTLRMPASCLIVSVLVKIPTVLCVHGRAWVFAGEVWQRIESYQAFPAMGGRKQIYLTEAPTEITMLFRTGARTVEEAEAEFTDEADSLLSRRQDNSLTTITGVEA